MKEIKLDCFLENEICKITSSQMQFELNNPLDKKFSLEISNHSQNDCNLILEAKNLEKSDFLSQVNLFITSEEKLIFEDDLDSFFKQKINLNQIGGKSIKKYYFDFDFLNLALENKKFFLKFDFLFSFNCEESRNINNEFISAEVKPSSSSQASVLAAKIDSQNINVSTKSVLLDKNYPWIPPFLYLLSSLFIVAFFVIIKFINGKKNKN
jgi:hypothetical protein